MHVPVLGLFVVMFVALIVGLWCFLCFRMGIWLAGGCSSRHRHSFACPTHRAEYNPQPAQPRPARPPGASPCGRGDKPSAGIGMLLVLLLLFLAFFGFRTRTEWKAIQVRATTAAHTAIQAQGPFEREKKVDAKNPRNPTWNVVKFGKTTEDAEQLAIEEAYQDLCAYVDRELPNPKWTPSYDYFRRHLMTSKQAEEALLPDDKGNVKVVAQQVSVTAELSPQSQKDLLHRGRMLLMLKILGAAVTGLIAVAGYIRIDELTKGYYTGWLRLAAVVGLGAAVLILT
jgi:hypothetical protein